MVKISYALDVPSKSCVVYMPFKGTQAGLDKFILEKYEEEYENHGRPEAIEVTIQVAKF